MENSRQAQTYLIGGLPRTGKTTLSTKLAGDLGTELIRTDTLRAMFGGEAGSKLAFASGLSIKKVIAAFDPYLYALVHGLPSPNGLVVEGELIGAKMAARLQAESAAVGCFLGLNDPAAADERISRNSDPNDWMSALEPSERLSLLEIYARRSDKLALACGRLGLRYYDASTRLDEVHEDAYDYLTGPHRLPQATPATTDEHPHT